MSENLEVQYRCLAELKEIDERAYLLERDTERIPEEIRKHDESLASKREALTQAKAQFSECEKKMRSEERELKDKEDSLFKAEGKMMEVKTNEEYQAALKENQNQKAAKGVLEDRVLKLITEMEEQRTVLGGIEKEFATYEQGILQQKKTLTDEHQEMTKKLEQVLRQRQTLSAQLDPTISSVYLKIVSLARGVAVTIAENGRCCSCNLQIRAQIYNEILGKKAIHRCGNCGRILIVSNRTVAAAADSELGAK